MKSKVGELDEEARDEFLRRLRKELMGVVQGVSGKKRFLVRFQYGREKYLTLNQLTVVAVEKILIEEEPEQPSIAVNTDDIVPSERGYYHGVHVLLHFHKEVGVDSKEEQDNVYPDPDEEDTGGLILDDGRELHWRIVFADNDGGVDYQKAILNANKWDVYMNKKRH